MDFQSGSPSTSGFQSGSPSTSGFQSGSNLDPPTLMDSSSTNGFGLLSGSVSNIGAQFGSNTEEVFGEFEPLNLPADASNILGRISTSFTCADRPYGYYADQENSCRVFHICYPALFANGAVETSQYSFLCGEGSVFDQKTLTCVPETDAVPCQESSSYFYTNEQFGRPEDKRI
ncbi:hypothetical protein C7M84_013159 [Penaeus vannamei]|uniref:Chitin-binding type-2 domain-containing protein n=1 Tax=Penaeus vannamei TaxID=6689 RepID=A0A423SWU3_PENVA|nr:hypothetical protein C7M84_013159 [Penaeus vannamei]